MAEFCLSSASILRCFPFRPLEKQLLVIPLALEAIFALWLLISNQARRGKDRWHLFLVAEAWTYTVLAVLDIIPIVVPAVRDHLSVFKTIDIVIASTCAIPIAFYMIFLYFFSTNSIIPELPQRLQVPSRLALLLFIPLVLITTGLSSFLGITRRETSSPLGPRPAIGFSLTSDRFLWTLLTSLSLGLFTAFQCIAWLLSLYRLILAFADQRRIEASNLDERRFFKGTGWISGGIKLGAVETVLGFIIDTTFGLVAARRVLRVCSRGLIVLGLSKGLDEHEDFHQVQEELRQRSNPKRRSNLRDLISNPRISTFLQLSPNPTRRMSQMQMYEPKSGDPRMSPAQSIAYLANTRRNAKDRVTIHFAPDNTPHLQMRFSSLDLPSPRMFVESMRESLSNSISGPMTRRNSDMTSSMDTGAYQSSFYANGRTRSGSIQGGMSPTTSAYTRRSMSAYTYTPRQSMSAYTYTPRQSTSHAPHRSQSHPHQSTSTLPYQSNPRPYQSTSEKEQNHRSMTSVASGPGIGELASQFPPLPTRVSLSGHSAVRMQLKGIAAEQQHQQRLPQSQSQHQYHPQNQYQTENQQNYGQDATVLEPPPPLGADADDWDRLPNSAQSSSIAFAYPVKATVSRSRSVTLGSKTPPADPRTYNELGTQQLYVDERRHPYADPAASGYQLPTPNTTQSGPLSLPHRPDVPSDISGSIDLFEDGDEDADEWARRNESRSSPSIADSGFWLQRKMSTIREEERRFAGLADGEDMHSRASPVRTLSHAASDLSVSSVSSRRRVPLPTRPKFTRGSVNIEPIVIPPRDGAFFRNTMLVSGSETATSVRSSYVSPQYEPAIRDSEVLTRASNATFGVAR